MSDDTDSAGSKRATLIRLRRSDCGSEGVLIFQNFHCYSLELPWKDNQQNISCIPAGKYTGYLQGQRAVLCSRPTITKFINLLQGQSFDLNILDTIAEL